MRRTAAAVTGTKATRSDQSQRPARPGALAGPGTAAAWWSAVTRIPTTTRMTGEMRPATMRPTRLAVLDAVPLEVMNVRNARGAAPYRQYFA